MTKKELYDYRKKNHLCTTCGSPVDDDRSTCKACRKKRHDKNVEKYRLYVNNGICPNCGKRAAENGSVLCASCRDRKRKSYFENSYKYNKRHLKKEKSKRRKLIKKGICPKCGKPTGTERVYCDKCLAYLRKQNRRYRANKGAKHVGIPRIEWSEHGWCNVCGVAVNNGDKICPICKERSNEETATRMRAILVEKREQWRKKGLCTMCGKHKAKKGYKICENCRQNQIEKHKSTMELAQEKREKLREQGLCVICGKFPSLSEYKVCQKCKDHLDAIRISGRKKVMPDGSE